MILLGLACGLIVLGGVTAGPLDRWRGMGGRFYAVCLVVGSSFGVASALSVLRGGAPLTATPVTSLPGGPWVFVVDPLAAWFLVPVFVVGAAAGIYGIAYLVPERHHRPVAVAHGLFAVLLVALVGVMTAQSLVPFLASWEAMALSGYFLIMFDAEEPSVRRAGFVYVVVTHLSTLALLLMFAVLSQASSGRTFDALAAANGVGSAARTFGLLAGVVGFGIKAGVVPMHFWLPGAHAAAPSHVSAVLSGLMLKAGVYGMLRLFILLGPPPGWLGWTLFGLGLVSGVLGVLWALGERDLKRVLAYSSVENIGIVLLGLGLGALGLFHGRPLVATLGLTAALLHALNHALFKSALFLGAGSVVRATGTRSIDRLGGLARQLPGTTLGFGLGAAAIVGLPPLNGFVSEWITIQGLIAGIRHGGSLTVLVLGLAGLGLIGALALSCFTRLLGAVFLGIRREPSESLPEQPFLVGPMLVLIVGCLVIGVAPALVVGPAFSVAGAIVGATGLVTPSPALDLSAVSVLGVLLIGVVAILWSVRRWAARSDGAKLSETWGCAYPEPTPRMQYTAASFAAPILLAFGRAAGLAIDRDARSLRSRSRDGVARALGRPLWRAAQRTALTVRALQQGPVTRYLQYIVFTVIVLLAALFTSIARRP